MSAPVHLDALVHQQLRAPEAALAAMVAVLRSATVTPALLGDGIEIAARAKNQQVFNMLVSAWYDQAGRDPAALVAAALRAARADATKAAAQVLDTAEGVAGPSVRGRLVRAMIALAGGDRPAMARARARLRVVAPDAPETLVVGCFDRLMRGRGRAAFAEVLAVMGRIDAVLLRLLADLAHDAGADDVVGAFLKALCVVAPDDPRTRWRYLQWLIRRDGRVSADSLTRAALSVGSDWDPITWIARVDLGADNTAPEALRARLDGASVPEQWQWLIDGPRFFLLLREAIDMTAGAQFQALMAAGPTAIGAEAYEDGVRCLAAQPRFREAAALMARLAERRPDHWGIQSDYGAVLAWAGAPDAARQALTRIPDDRAEAVSAHLNLAWLELRLDRLDAARAAYHRAMTLAGRIEAVVPSEPLRTLATLMLLKGEILPELQHFQSRPININDRFFFPLFDGWCWQPIKLAVL